MSWSHHWVIERKDRKQCSPVPVGVAQPLNAVLLLTHQSTLEILTRRETAGEESDSQTDSEGEREREREREMIYKNEEPSGLI